MAAKQGGAKRSEWSLDSLEDSSETVRGLEGALLDPDRVGKPDHAFRVALLGDQASGKRQLLHSMVNRTGKDATTEDACMDSLCGWVKGF